MQCFTLAYNADGLGGAGGGGAEMLEFARVVTSFALKIIQELRSALSRSKNMRTLIVNPERAHRYFDFPLYLTSKTGLVHVETGLNSRILHWTPRKVHSVLVNRLVTIEGFDGAEERWRFAA